MSEENNTINEQLDSIDNNLTKLEKTLTTNSRQCWHDMAYIDCLYSLYRVF